MFSIGKRLQWNGSKICVGKFFDGKYAYLEPSIFRINIVIARKDIKSSKKTYRKKELCQPKILGPAQGKKMKNLKSCSTCGIKDWYKFGILYFVKS